MVIRSGITHRAEPQREQSVSRLRAVGSSMLFGGLRCVLEGRPNPGLRIRVSSARIRHLAYKQRARSMNLRALPPSRCRASAWQTVLSCPSWSNEG